MAVAFLSRSGPLARFALREFRAGLGGVLSARDPALRPHSPLGRGLVAASSWLGGALLLLACVGVFDALRQRGYTFSSGSAVGTWRPKLLQDAEVLGILLLSVRTPLFAWRVCFASVVLIPLIAGEPRFDLPVVASLFVAYWIAGLRHERAIAWTMGILMLVPLWLWGGYAPGDCMIATAVLIVGAVALDATTSSRRAGRALAHQVAEREAGEARRAVLEERTRIAREMHDVVAHHMSMIAVQAETARYRLDGLSGGAVDEFAALSTAAREGLTDLRRLLGVLRSDAPAERVPQPQLADVATLVETTRRAGVKVELRMPTQQAAKVSPAVSLCAYRIVQEALSNAGRHAPGAPVAVTIEQDVASLRLDIVNSPPSNNEGGVSERGGRPGHGIEGMRERVTLLGGAFSARRHAGGGFAVSAQIPLTTLSAE